MVDYCEDCGCKVYNGRCINCQEDLYIEDQYYDLDMPLPDGDSDFMKKVDQSDIDNTMTPKEKATHLILMFKPNVYCFSGSGMLTNSYDEPTAFHYAVQCAIVAVNEMINDLKQSFELSKELHPHANGLIAGSLVYWQSVKSELLKNN